MGTGGEMYSGPLAPPGLSDFICTVVYFEIFAYIRRPGLGRCSICIMMTMLVDVFISVFQWCTSSDVRISLLLFRIDGFTYCITCGYCACRCCAHDNDVIGPFTGPGASQLVSEL